MAQSRRNPREEDRPQAVIEACQLLEDCAESYSVTMKEAAEDALSQWSRNWCEATPSAVAETLMTCQLTGKLESLAEESDEIEDVEELVNRALPDDETVCVDS